MGAIKLFVERVKDAATGDLTKTHLKDILKISFKRDSEMPAHATSDQIAFRYRAADSATGVTRETAKRLADHLGVDETQAIHHALHELAARLLPQYAADEGPLTNAQLKQIRKSVPVPGRRVVRSSLFEAENT